MPPVQMVRSQWAPFQARRARGSPNHCLSLVALLPSQSQTQTRIIHVRPSLRQENIGRGFKALSQEVLQHLPGEVLFRNPRFAANPLHLRLLSWHLRVRRVYAASGSSRQGRKGR